MPSIKIVSCTLLFSQGISFRTQHPEPHKPACILIDLTLSLLVFGKERINLIIITLGSVKDVVNRQSSLTFLLLSIQNPNHWLKTFPNTRLRGPQPRNRVAPVSLILSPSQTFNHLSIFSAQTRRKTTILLLIKIYSFSYRFLSLPFFFNYLSCEEISVLPSRYYHIDSA